MTPRPLGPIGIAKRLGRTGRRGVAMALALAAALATCAGPALAVQSTRSIDLDTSDLSLWAAVSQLAVRSNAQILMAAPVPEVRAPRLRGRFNVDQALARQLAGSGLIFRRTPDGGYVIAAPPIAGVEAPDVPVALPELLVLGRKTQNTDIARSENDIQPYKTWNARAIEQSHSADIQDFLRSQATADAQIAALLQDGGNYAYSTRSSINLRGVGASQTLVLIDGRRVPGWPEPATVSTIFCPAT